MSLWLTRCSSAALLFVQAMVLGEVDLLKQTARSRSFTPSVSPGRTRRQREPHRGAIPLAEDIGVDLAAGFKVQPYQCEIFNPTATHESQSAAAPKEAGGIRSPDPFVCLEPVGKDYV